MGFIRKGLIVILSILLFLSLLVGNIFLTLNLSLEYNNIKPELVSVIKGVLETQMESLEELGEGFEFMQLYCQNNSEFVVKYDEIGNTLVIPCNVISQGSEAVVNYGINKFVEDVYYKNYDCEFLDCFKRTGTPFFLISEQARDYWNSKFYFFICISLILTALIFFLVEHKTNLLIITGSLLAISALPFIKFNSLLSFISDNSFLQFFTVFFTKAYTVFLISFISGLVILGVGVGLKLWRIGTGKDKKVSNNKAKEIVKKEISKSKK